MAFVLGDRIKETSTTTGTGTFTLLGAVPGYQSFAAGVGTGNDTFYCIAHTTASEWEIGVGKYTTSGGTLTRDRVVSSSNNNVAVNFSSGTKNVFVTFPAAITVAQGLSRALAVNYILP